MTSAHPQHLTIWGMHLTPELPRSSIWAAEGYSRTREEFVERFAFRFRFPPPPSRYGSARSRRTWSHHRGQMVAYARNWCSGSTTRYRVVGSQVHTPI